MNQAGMHRFLQECFSDPALGAVIAVAVVLALVMAWFVFTERLKKRQKRQRRGRRRRETKGTATESPGAAGAAGPNPLETRGSQEP